MDPIAVCREQYGVIVLLLMEALYWRKLLSGELTLGYSSSPVAIG
jgi:hypothetical protein